MTTKHHKPEEIVSQLRQADVRQYATKRYRCSPRSIRQSTTTLSCNAELL